MVIAPSLQHRDGEMSEAKAFEPLLKPQEVCEELNISPATFWRKVWAGKIETVRFGRARRVAPEEKDRLKREGTD
jgi:excisionase family DNA binding protein